MPLKINVETVPHSCQRYETVGDWTFEADGTLNVNVSRLGNEDSEFLVAMHEIVEAYLCRKAGISTREVDEFDINYKGKYDEPGDDPAAPYFHQHFQGDAIERFLGGILGVEWKDHEERVDSAK